MMDYINREKLKWHSRRSILELDLYFDRFIKSDEFAQLSENELLSYQHILTLEDGDLLLLLQGKATLENVAHQAIILKIMQLIRA